MWKEFNPFVEWNIFHLDFSYDTRTLVTHFKQIAQIFQNKKKLTARTTDSTFQIHSQFLDNHLRINSSWATKINDASLKQKRDDRIINCSYLAAWEIRPGISRYSSIRRNVEPTRRGRGKGDLVNTLTHTSVYTRAEGIERWARDESSAG